MPRAKRLPRIAPDAVTSTGETAEDTVDSMADQPPQAPKEPELSKEKITKLGAELAKRFEEYKTDRRPAEDQWMKSLRQFLGVYDPDVQKTLAGRSEAYPKLTRVKVVSMLSRLMNLLFPSSEKNWTITASPVPNLSPELLQKVLDDMTRQGKSMDDDSITSAVREFASSQAKNLETEVEDQLSNLGGDAQLSYVAIARRVLLSGIMYGLGVLKGPFARTEIQTRWTLGEPDPETGQQNIAPDEVATLVPQYDFVPIWDYFPDMSAKYLHQMDGQFQRMVMSRQQLLDLAQDPTFIRDAIEGWLQKNQAGNYKEMQFESLLRSMSLSDPTSAPKIKMDRKYEVIAWDGRLSAKDLQGCGVEIAEDRMHEMYGCIVWFIDSTVIKCKLDPWETLKEPRRINTYHHFMFEEDDSSLVGNGLPQIMRDSQLGLCAAVRMTLDNAGIVCGPSVEVVRSLLEDTKDVGVITAYKVYLRNEDESSTTASQPAVRPIKFDSFIGELVEVANLFRGFADQETFVNPATGGDMQGGPSEPFRTAAGASMLTGLAALPFKDVVRNFDVFTESFMNSLIIFNKYFNEKDSIKGDFTPIARGATSLIAKEVRGIAIDELARTITPEEKLYVNWQGMLRERLLSRDIPVDTVMVSDEEAKAREEAQAKRAQESDAQMANLMRAETRKALADAVKAMTQSDKNASAADVQLYNALAQNIEKGVSPSVIAEVRAGADVPKELIQRKDDGGGKKPGRASKAAH